MTSRCNDILDDIAEVLTCKIKKELVSSLAPYREKINNGEKYEKVVLKLLESLPEYVELRNSYNNLLEENRKLKENNIVLHLDETEREPLNDTDMINNIESVCNKDQNVVLDDANKKTVFLTNNSTSKIVLEESEEEEEADEEEEAEEEEEADEEEAEEGEEAEEEAEAEEEVEVTDDEEEEGEEEEVEVTDDEEEVEEPKLEEKPKKSGKKPVNERKVPI